MDLDDIKAQLDRLFAARGAAASREQTAGLHAALVEFKMAVTQLAEALAVTERALVTARSEAESYERRGRLASDIGDAETVRIATEFTERARAKVDLLERKVLVQRDEVALAEREYAATKERFQAASRGVPFNPPAIDAAPPSLDEALLDQRAKEAAVDAQLAMLKKKLGERK
jgi:hypothetical protein